MEKSPDRLRKEAEIRRIFEQLPEEKQEEALDGFLKILFEGSMKEEMRED